MSKTFKFSKPKKFSFKFFFKKKNMNLLSTHQNLSIVSIIALTPYATPKPNDEKPYKYQPKDSFRKATQSLFSFDQSNDKVIKFRDSLFSDLEKNLSLCYELQTKYLFPPESQNLHQDLLPRFLHYLCDTSIPMSSLLPVPVLASIDFPTLFHSYLFSLHIPPDRASYVIHYYLFQTGMTTDELTEFLKSLTSINPKDYDYFIKLVHSLYTKNLLNHLKIIEWLIQKIQPELIEIFQFEIFDSFKLLSFSMNNINYLKYIKIMKKQLIIKPSQIVQLAVSMTYSSPEFNKRFKNDIFPLMNESSKKRANNIIKAIKNNNISLFVKTYLMLSLNFPYYDIPKILNEFQLLIQFLSIKEKKKYILEICELIHDFPNDQESVTAISIELIKKLNVQFPLNEFIEFLYSNVSFIENYTFFFYELQFQGFIDYNEFLKIITIGGKTVINYKATFKILEYLPPLHYTKIIRGKVRQIFLKNSEILFKYENIFNECCVDIEKNYENAVQLPPYFLYMIGYLINVKKGYDFFTKSHILAQLNLSFLNLSDLKEEEKKPVISSFALLQIKHFIPLLYSRGVLDKVIEICTNEKEENKYIDFCLFLKKTYDNSSYLANYQEKMKNIINMKKDFINTDKIAELAFNHSYLFNLFVYNDFLNVKTQNDLQKIFIYFLKNLLSFESLCVEHLFNFFITFTESYCIPSPLNFFINNFLTVILFEIKMNEKVKTVVTEFFYGLFSRRFFTGCEYLNSIYKILVSKRIDRSDCENVGVLFDILSSIVSKKPEFFTLTNLIQNSIVNWLTIRNHHLRKIVKPLSTKPIIITQSMMNLIHAPPSNYSAIFFYLLPEELLKYDIDEVVRFYFQNVDHRTMILWTIWLKYRPLYNIESIFDDNDHIEELIVTPNFLFNEYPESYRIQMSNYFLNITTETNNFHSNKIDIYLESFKLFCDNQKMANITFNTILCDLNQYLVKYSLNSIRLSYYLLSYLSDEQVENLCAALLRFNLDLIYDNDDSMVFKTSYLFLICFASFANRTKLKILMSTANKLLQLIPDIFDGQYKSTLFMIDSFNYYVSLTAYNDKDFHSEFVGTINNNLSKVKGKLKKAIILNQPPQMLVESQEPLYVNNMVPNSSLSSELLSGTNQVNDIFVDDIGDDWF